MARSTSLERLRTWKTQMKLRASDGTQREIDASVVVGDTLYVLECKAFSAAERIDRGDYAAITSRWKTVTEYLRQARTLAQFLERNRKGVNYSVPDAVTRFEYCLCTPLAEWIPKVGGDYWLDDETPRICVPQELVDFIARLKKAH